MSSGTLTLALLSLVPVANPSDVVPMNARNFQIPIHINDGQRSKIKELILFSSADAGATWQQAAVATPDKDAFVFYAPADGVYWFNVCVVDLQGNREPPDIYKSAPRQKVLVDTLTPGIRIVSAERQGDEIAVTWQIQEDHPELSTLKLEYRTPDSPAWMWYQAAATPALSGGARFRVVQPGPVSLRLQMADQAGNVGTAQAEVPAQNAPPNPALSAVTSNSPSAPAAMGSAVGSMGSAVGNLPPPQNVQQPNVPANSPPSNFPPSPSPSMAGQTSAQYAPAPVSTTAVPENPQLVQPTSLAQQDARAVAERAWTAASNSRPTASMASDPVGQSMTAAPATGSAAAAQAAGQRWPYDNGVKLQVTNNPQVTLDYEVTKVGPSGVGSVELYMSLDDGRTWQRYADDPDLKPPMTVNLPGEGVYGLRLVVGSRAGLGRKPPQPGDPPQMRIEVDTTPPVARLNNPQPDPHRRDALTLTWTATDHNLSPNPITLQWAERPDGNWQNIAADLPNTGRYTWQLTPNLPYRLHLRLLVRDTAGNTAVDEIPEPVLIDLHEPEGQLLGIVGTARHQ
jgi:hypothetical protein